MACLTTVLLLDSCGSSSSKQTQTQSPDFSLAATPASVALQAGAAGSAVSVTATGTNGFSGAVAVSIAGLPTGVTATPSSLNLVAGTAQSVTLAAASSAASASVTITFTGTSGSLTHAASLSLKVQPVAAPPAPPDVTTFHDDNARDGVNAQETALTLSTVNSTGFGKIGLDTADGVVDAEPLFLGGLNAGGQTRNVLFVATEHDSVYAFDADSGTQIWKTSVLGTGETTSDTHGCGQVTPEIGITSTPVIDRKAGANGTIFVVAMSKDAGGGYHQRLHALDVTTGAEMAGSPVEIAATYPGSGDNSSNGSVVFDPGRYKERAGLLLLNGNVYLAFSSHCDQRPYTGWVMAYSEITLQQTQLLNLTPNGSEGSVWMSGDGMAADAAGNIFTLVANGTFDTTLTASGFPVNGDYGNAILKMTSTGTLAVADYFETYNTVSESAADADLGSGGEVLLPDQTDAQGTVRHLIVGGGKDNNFYVADRDNLGKFNATGSNSNVWQELGGTGSIFSTPAFFNGVLYLGTVSSPLRAYPMTSAKFATNPTSQSAEAYGYPGTSPAVSANGTQNAIVWAVEGNTSAAAELHAYDATNLAHELYSSTQAANGRDGFGTGNKFMTPLIVNGKVYVGTPTGVAVFGLLGQ